MRTIPTRVGKTSRHWRGVVVRADHPHACGENFTPLSRCRRACGPSPRVWGKPVSYYWCCRCCRTIPTRVGKTCRTMQRLGRWKDHPHACGENFGATNLNASPPGPSPRVWGKRLQLLRVPPSLRTIPTRVGKTLRSQVPSGVKADHPHACGENATELTKTNGKNGPSPRVWGKLRNTDDEAAYLRTIPTRVGKTWRSATPAPRCTDHPHACGENSAL